MKELQGRFLFPLLMVMFLMLISSCKRCYNNDIIEYSKFEGGNERKPLYYIIDSYPTKCSVVYNIKFIVENGELSYNKNTRMKFIDNQFYLGFGPEDDKYFSFIDFRTLPTNSYIFKFQIEDDFYELLITLEEIHDIENDDIYRFRIHKVIKYYESFLDVVVFCSAKKGFMGTYLTIPEVDEKTILSPGGEIFKDYIDYSGFKEYQIL